jgi:hypothetical protein
MSTYPSMPPEHRRRALSGPAWECRAADQRPAGMIATVPGYRDMDIKAPLTHNASTYRTEGEDDKSRGRNPSRTKHVGRRAARSLGLRCQRDPVRHGTDRRPIRRDRRRSGARPNVVLQPAAGRLRARGQRCQSLIRDLAAEQLHVILGPLDLNRHLDDAVAHVLGGFAELRCHPDVAVGIHALSALGPRMVTLTNGATSVAQRLLDDAGLIDAFEHLLSAEQAGFWKPDPRA